MIKIACVQANVAYGDPAANADAAIAKLHELAADGTRLAVFPEAYLTGYCVDSHEEAERISIAVHHDSIQRLRRACDTLAILAVVGFAESEGRLLYNSAVLLEPEVEPRVYRKSHLPELGLDKHVLPGRELPVYDTAIGRIGVLICFDLRIPEATRVLALAGAELVVLPTNWPEGAEVSAEHVCIARCSENRIFMATCNRTGEENGFRFIGRSKVVDVTGKVIAAAGAGEETIVAELDLAQARIKRNVNIPGKYETAVFASRRPELYHSITEPQAWQ